MSNNSPVTILLRVKPAIENEKNKKEIIKIDRKRIVLTVPNTNIKIDEQKSFSFSSVYNGNAKTKKIYDDYCFAILNDVFKGYNGTIMAYGSTGSGKTFTMSGDPDNPNTNGIVQNIFQDLMKLKASTKESYLIYLSYFEIYQEKIIDLHGKDKTQSLIIINITDNPKVEGLVIKKCESVKDCLDFYNKGNKSRQIGETASNLKSSRSHAILQIRVIAYKGDESNKIREGTLYLVDLAGSERLKKTEAEGLRKEEAGKINLSTLALINVILALATNKPHIPYRNSNLTTVLKNSLGGNSKMILIANIHSTEDFYEEILNTLYYADRAQYIHNRATINEDSKNKNNLEECKKRERTMKVKVQQLNKNEDNLKDTENTVGNRFSFIEVDEALKREIGIRSKKTTDKLIVSSRNAKEYTDDEKKILQFNFKDLKEIDSSMVRKMLDFIKKQERVIETQNHELDSYFELSDRMQNQITDIIFEVQPEKEEVINIEIEDEDPPKNLQSYKVVKNHDDSQPTHKVKSTVNNPKSNICVLL